MLIREFNKIGINRVSIGIQSFNENVLFFCNRKKQNRNNIYNSLKILNDNNFNISIDLINGLPKQNIGLELRCLEEILTNFKNINHISFYDLSIEKGSYFYSNSNLNYLDESEKIKYERLFIKLIRKFGFKKYEVSNYAKNKKYSMHNLTYWKYDNYLGLGPAAHSKLEDLRIENNPEIDIYFEFKDYKKKYKLTLKEQIQEFILMGFRLVEGIAFSDFYERFSIQFNEIFIDMINKYQCLNKIKINKNRVALTNKGLNILNIILVDFFKELDKKF